MTIMADANIGVPSGLKSSEEIVHCINSEVV